MEIHSLTLGSLQVSAYIVIDGGQAILIDAPEGAEAIVEFCQARNLIPHTLVNTHGHGDHIFSNTALKAAWPGLIIAVGATDASLFSSPIKNLSIMFGALVKSPKADRLLKGGDTVQVGEATFEVIETPGHTKGGISLFSKDGPDGRPVVFTGDTLFAGGVGRTDFPGSSNEALMDSIRNRLLTLPPETVVYPGHGGPSTIGTEATSNSWL
jgi:hydroxyacylglutathione hydrolase